MIGSFEETKDGIQSKTIMAWTGDLSAIPSGWAVCDGNNGTPDLTDRMLRGPASSSTDAGNRGGTNSYSLAESNLPSHAHSFSTGISGSHSHIINVTSVATDLDGTDSGRAAEASSNTVTLGSSGSHNHSVSTSTTGSSSTVDNQPAYVKVIYIMKL